MAMILLLIGIGFSMSLVETRCLYHRDYHESPPIAPIDPFMNRRFFYQPEQEFMPGMYYQRIPARKIRYHKLSEPANEIDDESVELETTPEHAHKIQKRSPTPGFYWGGRSHYYGGSSRIPRYQSQRYAQEDTFARRYAANAYYDTSLG